ncbi:putative protein kinase RLK-Pelle-SD-2b family [Helianthus debilis subsp. tardiflorus]
MALIPLCLIISLTVLLHYAAAQRTNGSLSVGASLTATPDAKPWLSSSGEFALGFQKVEGTDNYLLSVWYEKIPDKTIFWYPEGGLTVATGSKVDLADRRGLVVSDPQGKEVWSSGSSSDLAYGYMNDTGNFVIVGSNSSNIWESFKYPSDTILPTQVLPIVGVVNSKMGKTNFTGGKYQYSNHGGDVLDFIELTNINWIGSDFASLNPSNEQTCRTSCLKDCLCKVAIYRDSQCWKKQLPLKNGFKDPSNNVKALVKFSKIDGPSGTGGNKTGTGGNKTGAGEAQSGTGEDKSGRSLIFVGSVLLGTSVLGIVVLIGVIYVCFFQIHKKKAINSYQCSTTDELGKGAFGIVYKGVIGTKIVAVKKLETMCKDSHKEFQTEVNTIARTHHKNLVQLLGYCDDGEQRLLIYEYITNGTLAAFLFGDMRPSWKQRSYIAVGVAKGLTYLHEDCSNQIIHCDIKPQNILLDDYYNAKIADFGLAKLLMINQSQTHTGIRGTKGYVAPEWFRNTHVTLKVDVYSFGVLLLEIISCRKSVVFDDDDDDDAEDVAVLTDSAWDCYQEGRLDAFVNNDLEALDNLEKLTTFMMVGLWCVQENPLLRPTMKKVVQMLEGVIEVTEPPCPFPFSVTSC